VCSSITRVRLQVGWQEQHPIVITCGKCGVSLSGKVDIGQIEPGLKFDFENAEVLNSEEKSDFVIECSGEFPTSKQYTEDQSVGKIITPFIMNMMRMADGGYEKFCKSVQTLIQTGRKWIDYKRVIVLAQNGNREYLLQEIKKIFPENIIPCRNEIEILRAIHMIEVHGFLSPLRNDLISDLSFSSDILKLNYIELTKFIDYLNNHNGYGLNELQSLIYKMLDEFIEIYQSLIPAFSMQFYKEVSIDYSHEGSSTSNFDSVKQFYIDAYEALGNLMILPIALNNVKYRGNMDLVNPIEARIKTLDDFISSSKATRYHLCDNSEIYTEKLNLLVNSKLRNAIGHNDVEYNTITQQITYFPNPKDRTKQLTEYLLEFENEAIHLLQAIVVISEYLYRLREIELITKGNIPFNQHEPVKEPKKIGRNEKCPCGSGLKYKYCHGR
jgi:hypothetical protein